MPAPRTPHEAHQRRLVPWRAFSAVPRHPLPRRPTAGSGVRRQRMRKSPTGPRGSCRVAANTSHRPGSPPRRTRPTSEPGKPLELRAIASCRSRAPRARRGCLTRRISTGVEASGGSREDEQPADVMCPDRRTTRAASPHEHQRCIAMINRSCACGPRRAGVDRKEPGSEPIAVRAHTKARRSAGARATPGPWTPSRCRSATASPGQNV